MRSVRFSAVCGELRNMLGSRATLEGDVAGTAFIELARAASSGCAAQVRQELATLVAVDARIALCFDSVDSATATDSVYRFGEYWVVSCRGRARGRAMRLLEACGCMRAGAACLSLHAMPRAVRIP